MGGFLIAWLVALGLSIVNETFLYRSLQGQGVQPSAIRLNPLPPKPGRLMVASGVFVMLAIMAEVPSMRTNATLLAWGYNVALGLKFATQYQAGQGLGLKQAGTYFWSPPPAPGDVLFPTGGGQAPVGVADVTLNPGRSSGGPMAA